MISYDPRSRSLGSDPEVNFWDPPTYVTVGYCSVRETLRQMEQKSVLASFQQFQILCQIAKQQTAALAFIWRK